jgi:tyrosine-protein phosphatase YwqE
VIDIYCPILAHLGDGPKSWDVAEEMCHIAAADGIEHIVATPHANTRYEYDRKLAKAHVQDLHAELGHDVAEGAGEDNPRAIISGQAIAVFPESCRRTLIDRIALLDGAQMHGILRFAQNDIGLRGPISAERPSGRFLPGALEP